MNLNFQVTFILQVTFMLTPNKVDHLKVYLLGAIEHYFLLIFGLKNFFQVQNKLRGKNCPRTLAFKML